MGIMEIAVLLSVFLLVYNYVLYPALVIFVSKAFRQPEVEGFEESQWPKVSFIIAAYNEERVIRQKLENTLEIDYPKDRFEVMVVADGSDDHTADYARQFEDRGVRLLHTPERRGKTAALNRGVAEATGEIVVFSDANNDYDRQAIRKLVRHFANERIGGVCGSKRIKGNMDRESASGDSLYWKYESAIKQAESRIGSITGGDGEIFAVRKSLYESIDEHVINDDAEITMNILDRGGRVIYDSEAMTYEEASISIVDDFFVKVRMVSGGYQTISRYPLRTLLPLSWFSFTFLSHKVLRWMAPLFMIVALLGCLLLVGDPVFLTLLLLQLPVYALALIGWGIRGFVNLPGFVYVPFYLCTMNTAALFGLVRYLRGTQTNLWRKAVR